MPAEWLLMNLRNEIIEQIVLVLRRLSSQFERLQRLYEPAHRSHVAGCVRKKKSIQAIERSIAESRATRLGRDYFEYPDCFRVALFKLLNFCRVGITGRGLHLQ